MPPKDRRKRHRTRIGKKAKGGALADRTAKGQNRANAHDGRANDLTAQFTGVFAGLPTEMAATIDPKNAPANTPATDPIAKFNPQRAAVHGVDDGVAHRGDKGMRTDVGAGKSTVGNPLRAGPTTGDCNANDD